MTKYELLSKSRTKRVTAAAIAEAKARRAWSNAEAGAAMDCSEGTVRQRLDDDDNGHQMTVHELRRVTQADGPAIANRVLADLGYRLVPVDAQPDDGCALALATMQTRCTADLLEAAADGIDPYEARELLPKFVDLSSRVDRFKQSLRATIEGKPTSQ